MVSMGGGRVAGGCDGWEGVEGGSERELTWFCVLGGLVLVELVDGALVLVIDVLIAGRGGGHGGDEAAGGSVAGWGGWGRRRGGSSRRGERKSSIGFNEFVDAVYSINVLYTLPTGRLHPDNNKKVTRESP